MHAWPIVAGMIRNYKQESRTMSDSNVQSSKPASFEVRILRQQDPKQPSHWERYRVLYESNLNVISVLQKIATHATTATGKSTTPVAWDCNCLEEVCGACTMLVNGRTRQACSALVDKLLEEHPDGIELRPMSKFPVVRDLVVDRGRMFRCLERVSGWIPVDDYYDRGPGPRESQAQQQVRYPLSECMTCGCCVEACPQFTRLEVTCRSGESDEQFERRRQQSYDKSFVGPAAISQAILFNDHGTGALNSGQRLDALMDPGGVQICGNAQNCVAVCPKEIPLTTSIARVGRQTTLHAIRRFFDS
jgi:succinate dehydrogenase / fumarate reductase iron-sulfur subunit